MKMLQLKNGTEEHYYAVNAIMVSLKKLKTEDVGCFHELVMKCRNPSHRLFGNSANILIQHSLLEKDMSIHNSVKNVVLSAVTGDGLLMDLESPVQ